MVDQSEEKPAVSMQGWWLRICRHRFLLMVLLLAGWALVTSAACFLPTKYRSETMILIEQQRVPEKLVESNVAVDLQQRLQSMSEQILSRTRLIGIIEKLRLYSEKSRRLDSDALVETMRKDIGVDLIKGERPDQISAFKVSYSANSSVVAQQVTAELTSLFIEENLRNREQLSEDTTSFLQTELDGARKNLDQQEQRLREFKNKYMGQLPEQTASNVQILSGLQSRLQAATDALNQAEQQKLYLQSLLSDYRAMHPTVATLSGTTSSLPPSLELDQKLVALKSQLAELSAKYTPRHPDVVRLQEEINATEKAQSRAEEQAKSAKQPGQTPDVHVTGDAQSRSAMVQVESQLKANELDIANRKTEIKKLETDIDSYQQRLNLAPAREQALAAITRDHEQSLANYDSLLKKRDSSAMATSLEKRQQGEQFRMIDPPSLPQKPYFPNRLFFSLGGVAFGLALGLGVVVVMELANPRLYGEDELSAIVTAPILITIPPLPTPAEHRKKLRFRALELVTAIVMLVAIPAVTLFFYRKG